MRESRMAFPVTPSVIPASPISTAAQIGTNPNGTALSLGMRDTAARANVAEFILDCLEDLYVHEMPKVTDA
jgi:hypothetical protein